MILCPRSTPNQPLRHLPSTRMKKKPSEENAIVPHIETKNVVHPFISR